MLASGVHHPGNCQAVVLHERERPYIPGPQHGRRLSADVRVVTGVGASAQENMKSLGTTALLSWVAGEDDDPRVSLD